MLNEAPLFADIGNALAVQELFSNGTTTSSKTAVTLSGSVQMQSDFATAYPTGGQPPYTFAWAAVSNPHNILISYPPQATTNFHLIMSPTNIFTGTFACTVTDLAGNTAVGTTLTVTFEVDT